MNNDLFQSAAQMESATNYAEWTQDQFASHIQGDVLEVGCGVGSFTRRLALDERVISVRSIDINLMAVAHTQRHVSDIPKVSVEHCDLMEVDGRYDLVICLNVLEHVEDDKAFLKKLLSLLKPQGILFLLVPAHSMLYCEFDREGGHLRRYSKSSLKRIADYPNTQILRQYYFNPIGALGYYIVYKLLRRSPRAGASNEIGLFDKLVVPISKFVVPKQAPFGISLITVFQNRATSPETINASQTI